MNESTEEFADTRTISVFRYTREETPYPSPVNFEHVAHSAVVMNRQSRCGNMGNLWANGERVSRVYSDGACSRTIPAQYGAKPDYRCELYENKIRISKFLALEEIEMIWHRDRRTSAALRNFWTQKREEENEISIFGLRNAQYFTVQIVSD